MGVLVASLAGDWVWISAAAAHPVRARRGRCQIPSPDANALTLWARVTVFPALPPQLVAHPPGLLPHSPDAQLRPRRCLSISDLADMT